MEERRLLADGALVRLGPLAFDVLAVLVERAGHLVTKDELLKRVWPKVVVEENNLQVQVSALRKALGADAIATVTGRGYRFTPALIPADPSAPAFTTAPAHNLPYPLTSFIGRENELAALKALLASTRLLTLTGAGGCGKTRLATQLAMRLHEGFEGGAWMVELAPLNDHGRILEATATVLGIREQPGKALAETITDHVAQRSLLLLLDNAEHVIEACAVLVDALLKRCGRLVILVTSRERLGITGEATYRVPSLSVFDAKDPTPLQIGACESGRLFVERARLEQPDFAVTPENAKALASICRRLDGIALAIELAAPRVRSMSLDELGRRLDERFELLVGGSRTALPRHRTLHALIDWSYELLGDAERATLRRISVFCGGWTLAAARSVCRGDDVREGEVLELLTALADKNLVLSDTSGGVTRYDTMESIRHFALERLRASDEEVRVRRAHLAYFTDFVEAALPELNGPEQGSWVARYAREHDNVRAALSFATSRPDEVVGGLRLAAASWRFWLARGYLSQGFELASEQLARSVEATGLSLRARCLHGAASLTLQLGHLARARALSEESVEISRRLQDRRAMAVSLGGLGNILSRLGEYDQARACLQEGVAILRERGERVDAQLNNLGIVLQRMGDLDGARVLHEEALALRRERGDVAGIGNSLGNLGDIAHKKGAFAQARELFEAAAEKYAEAGDPRFCATTAVNLAFTLCELQDPRGAQAAVKRGLPTLATIGDREHIGDALYALGDALATRDPIGSAVLWGAGARLREECGIAVTALERARDERWKGRARATLRDDGAFDAAFRTGRSMAMDRAVEYALEIE